MMWWLWITAALADQFTVVRSGEDLQAVASRVGLSDRTGEIAAMNRLEGPVETGQLISLPDAADKTEAPAFVATFTGKATVQAPNADPVPVTHCMELPLASRVCTQEGGTLPVRLRSSKDGAYADLTLLPNTCLTVAASFETGNDRQSLVNVDKGAISVSSDGARPGAVTVVTPRGPSVP